MKKLHVESPFTGTLLKEIPYSTPQEISKALQVSTLTFQKWRHSSAWEKSQLLTQVAQQLELQKEDFAQLICEEAGKPIQLARTEVTRGVSVLQWAASEAQRFAGELLRLDTSASGRPGYGIHTRFPRGAVLGITPFNFPLNLVLHKVAPAIAIGSPILIKPSPFTPLTARKLQEVFDLYAPGLMQVLIADDTATAELTRAPEIKQISFTGSANVGWQIRRQAPEKPTTLELGGNAWVIILEDTPAEDFPLIAQRISNAAYGYAGQSCISVQNVAVASPLWSDFKKHLTSSTENMLYGDPRSASVVSGPLIHTRAAERVRSQLGRLPSEVEIISSKKPEGTSPQNSNVIAPTLLMMPSQEDAEPFASVVQEEIFGPVMTARKFTEAPQIIQKINSSRYGLQAGVFTQHWPTIEKLYRELEVGGLVVNDVPTTRYDHQPYGGVKDSGQGREGLKYAMEEMTESKFLALSSKIP
jgi:acyl-CoA reductase-like NAD-dependent aldehyde dehydrogenase